MSEALHQWFSNLVALAILGFFSFCLLMAVREHNQLSRKQKNEVEVEGEQRSQGKPKKIFRLQCGFLFFVVGAIISSLTTCISVSMGGLHVNSSLLNPVWMDLTHGPQVFAENVTQRALLCFTVCLLLGLIAGILALSKGIVGDIHQVFVMTSWGSAAALLWYENLVQSLIQSINVEVHTNLSVLHYLSLGFYVTAALAVGQIVCATFLFYQTKRMVRA
jgi:hypothetical protein